jgi:4-diphosphocytidyl-2-C-methyl-D-erythritol kinase
LIAKACRLVMEAAPDTQIGRIRLTKNLPVAAGVGGGSADAAAVLRALVRANPALAPRLDLRSIAARLGADVTVCLEQRPALMWGVGERVEPMAPLPGFWVVLANPGVPLATADVFRGLGAPPLTGVAGKPEVSAAYNSLAALIAVMRRDGNGLQPTAIRLCPPIANVIEALQGAPGCLHAAQSGSGPTCFGLFATATAGTEAAAQIKAAEPKWWVAAAAVGSAQGDHGSAPA